MYCSAQLDTATSKHIVERLQILKIQPRKASKGSTSVSKKTKKRLVDSNGQVWLLEQKLMFINIFLK